MNERGNVNQARIVNLFALRESICVAIRDKTNIDHAVNQFGLIYPDDFYEQEIPQSMEDANVSLYWRDDYLESQKPHFPPKYHHLVGRFYIDEDKKGLWMEASYKNAVIEYALRGDIVRCFSVRGAKDTIALLTEWVMAAQVLQ